MEGKKKEVRQTGLIIQLSLQIPHLISLYNISISSISFPPAGQRERERHEDCGACNWGIHCAGYKNAVKTHY